MTSGYKQFMGDVVEAHQEELGSLHEPAWWTGVRVYSPYEQRMCTFRLVGRDGLSLGPQFEWSQQTGTWAAFPWPIPAFVAKAMDLKLELCFIGVEEATTVSMRICFHEMPDMPNDVNYMFFGINGFVTAAWHASQSELILARSQEAAAWNSIHFLVPRTERLLQTPLWDDDRLVCFHNWNERVST